MSAKNYAACLAETLRHEGGYFNHPKDPGGETMYGIIKTVARANGYTGPMKQIPMDLVKRIYREDYWKKVRGDSLPEGVDLAVFDFGVNSGPSRANRYFAALPAKLAPVDAVKRLCASRLAFVRALKTWAYFGKGWGRRIASVEAVGVRMALVATGKAPKEVQKDLRKEGKDAQKKRNKDVVKGGGAASGPVALPTPDAFDLYSVLYVGLGVAAVAAVVYFGLRAYHNNERFKAYVREGITWVKSKV
jgi:lysozyme family protein